jgi:GNAT superfamily N-acetyltransferase
MAAYRFCRTDDIALLVDALNRCRAPSTPGEPATTAVAFKRSIRDLQVWCSSCMVAFAGPDPVAVLIGAKRSSATLVEQVVVHPDHRRHGHGLHLLASLGSKLSILGPPRMVAEVPEGLTAARGLFSASGYAQEAVLTDYVIERDEPAAAALDDTPPAGRFVIPVSVDDLAANGLLDHAGARRCWARSVETLTARKHDIAGLAIASDERIEAYLLYLDDGEIVALHSLVDDAGFRLTRLLARLHGASLGSLRLSKVHPAEIPTDWLDALGFRAAGRHILYAARAGATQAALREASTA